MIAIYDNHHNNTDRFSLFSDPFAQMIIPLLVLFLRITIIFVHVIQQSLLHPS